MFRLGKLGTWVDTVTEQGSLWDQKRKKKKVLNPVIY